MKKFTLFTFLFLLSMTFAFAQNPIRNPNFETWRPYSNGTASGTLPVSWWTSDSTYIVASSGTAGHSAVQEIVNKCDSNYAIKLSTISTILGAAPGVATNGSITGLTLSNIIGGAPDQIKHLNFTGCYAYTEGGPANIPLIGAFLFHWNGAARDTIAVAVLNPAPAASMTNFTVPFVYKIFNQLPDTIVVVLSSSPGVGGVSSVVGSILYVDHLSVSGINTVTDPNAFKNVKVYPSPVTGNVLNIDVMLGRNVKSTYSLIDALGRMVRTGELKETQALDVSHVANGMYTLTLNNSSGDQLYSTRVTISR